MTITPLPARGPSPHLPASRLSSLSTGATPPRRKAPTNWSIRRRRWMVGFTKRVLPLAAVGLLAVVALWPEISGENDRGRFSYRRGAMEAENGQILSPRYRGADERNRPYTMTASVAVQKGPERVDLTDPKGDISLESGNWLMIQSKQGVYLQKTGQLDLSGDVTLYRDDGTTLTTSSSAVDLKAGAAAGSEMTHVEGPFGSLDAQGFALTDKGATIRFTGPGRLVLNSRSK